MTVNLFLFALFCICIAGSLPWLVVYLAVAAHHSLWPEGDPREAALLCGRGGCILHGHTSLVGGRIPVVKAEAAEEG